MSLDQDRWNAGKQGRDLGLPLVDHQDSEIWAGIEAMQRDEGVWPALTDALSGTGRRLLWEALHEAVDASPNDPERALMVVEAFWRTMRLRRGPNYQQRLWASRGAIAGSTPDETTSSQPTASGT